MEAKKRSNSPSDSISIIKKWSNFTDIHYVNTARFSEKKYLKFVIDKNSQILLFLRHLQLSVLKNRRKRKRKESSRMKHNKDGHL